MPYFKDEYANSFAPSHLGRPWAEVAESELASIAENAKANIDTACFYDRMEDVRRCEGNWWPVLNAASREMQARQGRAQ